MGKSSESARLPRKKRLQGKRSGDEKLNNAQTWTNPERRKTSQKVEFYGGIVTGKEEKGVEGRKNPKIQMLMRRGKKTI